MNTAKWFDRKFDFNLSGNDYAVVVKRLQQVPGKIKEIIAGLSNDVLENKPEGKWSIKEHVGHLIVLESLWRVRILDIQQSKPVLTPADLENKATSDANFNNWNISTILEKFTDERNETMQLFNSVKEEDKIRISLHPRLNRPMRIIDHAYFVAEHDDHHIATITEITRLFNK